MASPLDGYTSLLDRQRLQQQFDAKKQMQQLQLAATLQELNAPAISAKDLMGFQLQAQNMQQQTQDRALDREMRMDVLKETNQTKRDLMQEKLDEKKNQKRMVDQNLMGSATSSIDTQLGLIDEILGKVDPVTKQPLVNKLEGVEGNFGFKGAFPNIPGSDSSNASATLDRLDAKSFIDSLGQMKAQSATGASGLGSATEREGDKVQAAAAALKRSQDYPSFVKNLKIYQKELNDSKKRLQGNFNNIYSDGGMGQSPLAGQGAGVNVTVRPTPQQAAEILRQRAAARMNQ